MRRILSTLIAPYKNADYVVLLRAIYLRFITLALMFVLPILFILDATLFSGARYLIKVAIVVLWLSCLLILQLIRKGKLAFAGHTLMVLFLGSIGLVMLSSSASVVERQQTVVLLLAVLSTLPLMIHGSRFNIAGYYLATWAFVVFFSFQLQGQGAWGSSQMRDYLVDTSVALLFMGIASYAISMISNKALKRTRKEIEEHRIAEKKVREQYHQLEEAGLLLHRTIDAMPSVVMSFDGESRITGWNSMAAQLTGVSTEEATGKRILECVPLLERWEGVLGDTVRGGDMYQQKRIILGRKDSKPAGVPDGSDNHLYDLTIYPLAPGKQLGAVLKLDDVTEQVRFEKVMVHAEKMLSVGGLAAGMAHEINNPLAGILQNVQVIRNRLNPTFIKNRETADNIGISLDAMNSYLGERKIHEMFEAVVAAGKHAAEIVENMISFSVKDRADVENVDIPSLIDRTLNLARNEYDLKKNYDFRKIQIETHFTPDLPFVHCQPNSIQQVLLNILRNGSIP